MTDTAGLLRAYDEQLRTGAETAGAASVVRHGPLLLATFAGGQGFVTYRDLAGVPSPELGPLVAAALEHFRTDPGIRYVEWKTRGHDHAPGLPEALTGHGFAPEDPETVMVGEMSALAVDVVPPDGVTLRRVVDEPDVRAVCAVQDEATGTPAPDGAADELLQRLALGDGTELWVAEAAGRVIGTGRLEPVAGTAFAGLWGGAVLAAWRGRGVYRALTAARARSALTRGRTLVHSDCTGYSRPILERAGLVAVSTTTPYVWNR